MIAKRLDPGVPESAFADMLLDGSGLSWEEGQKVFACVSSKDEFDKVSDALVARYPMLEVREGNASVGQTRILAMRGRDE